MATALEPIKGYTWMRAREGRERLTPVQWRGLHANPERPRDRVIERERWVAIPEGLLDEGG